MQIVIVAPCLLPQTTRASCTTPPQLAMHLAACTPVRHRVRIMDRPGADLACADDTDLYALLWSEPFSPLLLEMAMQLAAYEPLVCIWDGPMPAPVDYLLEFFDYVVCTSQGTQWQQLLMTIENEQRHFA